MIANGRSRNNFDLNSPYRETVKSIGQILPDVLKRLGLPAPARHSMARSISRKSLLRSQWQIPFLEAREIAIATQCSSTDSQETLVTGVLLAAS